MALAGPAAANKAKIVRDLLKMRRFDPQWMLPGLAEQSPLTWMMQVSGIVVDVRHMPREVQELAFAKGLIPYGPADRERG